MFLISPCPVTTAHQVPSEIYGGSFTRESPQEIETSAVFLLSSRNTSGQLGEREVLWEQKVFPKLLRVLSKFHSFL